MRSISYGMAMVVFPLIVTSAPPAFAEPVADGTESSGQRPAKPPAHKRTHSRTTADADERQHGNASFYSKHLSGRKTASGDAYDPGALTAAHRTLPMGTQVKVINPKNDKSVVVTVNDRGPVPKNRMIDVSSAAADELGMKKAGVTRVETQVVGKTAPPKNGDR